MHRIAEITTSLAMVGILAIGLATYQSVQAAAPTAAAGASAQIAIQNFAFSPQTLTVAVGTTVTWTNKDSAAHTVTSDTGAWTDSGMLDTNKSFSVTFSKPGTYTYKCAVHPSMTATIKVTGAGAGSSATAAAAPIKLAPAHILVTATGFALYVFAPDGKNKSTCYSSCAKFWPPLLAPKGTKPAASMPGVPGTFGVAPRTDGTLQYTYDGAPLYTFLNDKKPGDMNGQGLVAAGGYWWLVVAAGK
jgi:plastocyanin